MPEAATCEEDDRLLEKWTFMRFAVMGVILLYRAWSIRQKGKLTPEEHPYKDHPKLTEQMNQSNTIVGMIVAICIFIQSEGVGLVIYFGTSAALDNITVYVVDIFVYCEYVMQVALYSMAIVTFLPCVLVSYLFQARWYDVGQWWGFKGGFILLMMAAAMTSFLVRLLLVFKLGWDDLMHGLLSTCSYKVVIAIFVPPLVDALQTVMLIAASFSAKATGMAGTPRTGKYDQVNNGA